MTPPNPKPGQSSEELFASAKSREKRSIIYSLILVCASLAVSLVILLASSRTVQSDKEDLSTAREIAALRDTLNAKISAATEHSRETHDQIQKLNSELASLTSLIKATSATSAAAAEQLAQVQNQLSIIEDKAQINKSSVDFAQKSLEEKITTLSDGNRSLRDDFDAQLEALVAGLRATNKKVEDLTARMVEVEARENQDATSLEDARRAIGQK